MAKAEEEAYLHMAKLEREREEKEFAKRLKEEAERKERLLRSKKFLEAAYDGNLAKLEFLISDLQKELNNTSSPQLDEARRKRIVRNLIDSKDSNNNTALSEAAAGGSAQVVKFLLEMNADPNSRGAFGRTPLWRSAFAGFYYIYSNFSC